MFFCVISRHSVYIWRMIWSSLVWFGVTLVWLLGFWYFLGSKQSSTERLLAACSNEDVAGAVNFCRPKLRFGPLVAQMVPRDAHPSISSASNNMVMQTITPRKTSGHLNQQKRLLATRRTDTTGTAILETKCAARARTTSTRRTKYPNFSPSSVTSRPREVGGSTRA